MADMPIELFGLDISAGAKLLLAYLWRHAGRDRFVWPGRSTIATDLRISDRTLRRYLGELRDAHVLVEDTEVRRGWFRSGWWLSVDASSPDPSTGVDRDDERCASLDTADLRSPSGQIWPPPRPERTASSAGAARSGRLSSIEPRINQDSLSRSSPLGHTGPGRNEPERRDEPDLDRLRRWRIDGSDPEGLGPWPQPQLANGIRLPRLALSSGVQVRLEEGRSPEELHRAVHLVAELVEAGKLPPDKWRAGFVFSGWLDQLVIQALEHRAQGLERPSVTTDTTSTEPLDTDTSRDCSHAFMQSAMETSEALGRLARQLREPSLRSERPCRSIAASPSDYIERLELRGQVQAIAEELGCDVSVVLRELGRTSIRDLRLTDKAKLGRVFITIREGSVASPSPDLPTREPTIDSHINPLHVRQQSLTRSPHHVETQTQGPTTTSPEPAAHACHSAPGNGPVRPASLADRPRCGAASTDQHQRGVRDGASRPPAGRHPTLPPDPRRRGEAAGLAGRPPRVVAGAEGGRTMIDRAAPLFERPDRGLGWHAPRAVVSVVDAPPTASTAGGAMLRCPHENRAVSLTQGVQ